MDFYRKTGLIQPLSPTIRGNHSTYKIKTLHEISFVRCSVKSQEYSLRPLCPVWNSAVKGFSCGHLSGRDIMILQLETESWDLFISTNSSPRCAEHIKYHRGNKKSQHFVNSNYRCINSFTVTSNVVHIHFHGQEQCRSAVNVYSLKAAFVPAQWHLAFQRPLCTSSDKWQHFINRNDFGIINSKWISDTPVFKAYHTKAGFSGSKGIFYLVED